MSCNWKWFPCKQNEPFFEPVGGIFNREQRSEIISGRENGNICSLLSCKWSGTKIKKNSVYFKGDPKQKKKKVF
jgi:hypothetical protein